MKDGVQLNERWEFSGIVTGVRRVDRLDDDDVTLAMDDVGDVFIPMQLISKLHG